MHPYNSVLEYLSSQQPHPQPQAHTRALIHFHLIIPPDARPCPLDSTRFLDTEIPICADSAAQVHELDRLFVHLAGCSNGERYVPPPPFVYRLVQNIAEGKTYELSWKVKVMKTKELNNINS